MRTDEHAMWHSDVFDVAVVGCGPVGAITALRLGQAGLRVAVIEQAVDAPRDQRASTCHPPTLDMLGTLGIVPSMICRGMISPYFQFRDHDIGPVAQFDCGSIADIVEHPYRVSCEQWKIVEIVRERLRALDNVMLIEPAHATDVTQDADGVRLALSGESGVSVLAARYAIACDGIRSQLREAAGIAYEGYTITDRYWVLTTPFDFADVLPGLAYVNYVTAPDRWYSMVRGRNHWRVLFPTVDGTPDDHLARAEVEQEALRSVHPGVDYRITHRKLYRVHQRVAATFRHGRLLLAGDAAHANSPLGGQGMNSGIHDSFALTDALLAVFAGGPDDLLDLYSRRRKWAALNGVQAHAARTEQFLREREPSARQARIDEMRRTGDDPQASRDYVIRASMLEGLRRADAIA